MTKFITSFNSRALARTAGVSLALIFALALLTVIPPGPAGADTPRPPVPTANTQVALIHMLQAAFHEAQSYNDAPDTRNEHRQLMSELWADDATLTIVDANISLAGIAQILDFWEPRLFADNTPRRVSLVPSFRTAIDVHGENADIYFECHIVNPATDQVVAHRFFTGTARRVRGQWVFQDVEIGPASL